MRVFFAGLVLVCLFFLHGNVRACTTTIVGKKASATGSVLVSHSCDGFGDPRILHIPAKDHAPGSKRPVFYSPSTFGFDPQWGADSTHRIVTDYFGKAYDTPGVAPSIPLGFIPQVAHTYAYITGRYGILNEHQLLIGECTDKAKVRPKPEPGKRIMYASALSVIALERCTKAREAIRLMGDLIERFGYYGPGETLLVADPDEAWVMEMCAYRADGNDGVWVAQRVPDDAFFVAANQFRIREIRIGAPDMLYAEHIFDAAASQNWWKTSDGPLDWTRVFGDGEFHHPYYSLRRVWRAQSLVAPGRKLPAWVHDAFTKEYPFSLKPERKLGVADVFAIHRDNYEGSEFDLTKGLAAGPFGDPTRFEGGSEATMHTEKGGPVAGAFERPLNIYRCAYAYVSQARASLPDAIGGVTWIGFDRPATAVLLPFYAGAQGLPASMRTGDPLVYDENSLWMAFNYVANYAMLRYDLMRKDIDAKRETLEAQAFSFQPGLEKAALELWEKGEKEQARELLTRICNGHADAVRGAWWQLSRELYIKYNNGYCNTKEKLGQKLFYPDWWLRDVGYENGPTSYAHKPGEH